MACKRSTAGWAALAASMLLAAWPAAAQTVYKLVDKNGKITYSETPPKEFDGKVIRIDLDPNANKASLGVPTTDTGGATQERTKAKLEARDAAKAQSREERVQAARDKLAAAKQSYEQARDNPGEEDMRFIGNAGGGTRRVPTEAYEKRLAQLEHRVKEAEDALHQLE
jgi:hypothetical protein